MSVFSLLRDICIQYNDYLVEHVAEWLRHWTQNLGVWGSIPTALVTCKSLGQAFNPHQLCQPSSNGYQVE